MICEKCNSKLHYGDKFCNVCGEKIDTTGYEKEYNKTIWGVIDKIADFLDIIMLKKITGNWIVKVLLLLAIAGWGFFDAYTDFASIRILESESYSVEYNKNLDEYYVRTSKDEIDLNLYIPKYTDNIKFKEVNDKETSVEDMTVEEYIEKKKEKELLVKKNSFEYLTVDSVRNGKVSDSIKVYIID